MRIARFWHDGEISYGLVLGADPAASEAPGGANGSGQQNGSGSANGSGVPESSGTAGSTADQRGEGLMVAQLARHPFGPAEDLKLTGIRFPLSDIRLLAPILPSKVICIGKNYADHAREMGGEPPEEPVI